MALLAIGALLWLAGAAAWLTYLLGRFLGAPSWQASVASSGDRWRIAADVPGDGWLTLTDVALWSGWLAYLPGDGLVEGLLALGIGALLESTQVSFGGTLSAVVSCFVWFGLGSGLLAAGGADE